MKYLWTLLLPFALLAQETTNEPINVRTNVLVRFYADNKPYVGITNYPMQVENVETTEVLPGWSSNFTQANWDLYMAAMREAVKIPKSNAVYAAKVKADANLARLLELYAQIPIGRTNNAISTSKIALLETSLASGTNTTAALVVSRVRQLNSIADDINRRQGYILEYLQRLGPVLKSLYRPQDDLTQ